MSDLGFARLFLGAVVVFIFILVPALSSRVGGWHDLAEGYATSASCRGTRLWCRPAQVGFVRYGAVIQLGADTTGLYMSLLIPFRIAHPALFFPWHDISAKKIRAVWGEWIELKFEKCPERGVAIRLEDASRLFAAGGRSIDGLAI